MRGRGLRTAAAICLAAQSLFAAAPAHAATRSVRVVYRYPTSGNYAGVALYAATSAADLLGGPTLARFDLGLQPIDSQGLVTVVVPGFDTLHSYFVVLRSYDAAGNESPSSAPRVVPAQPLYADDFESYAPGTDPTGWIDSAPGQAAPGDATLFEATQLADGNMVYAAASSSAEIYSHLDASGAGSWSDYEYSGRLESDALGGGVGVTVLSQYPESQFFYRLSSAAGGAFALDKRGGSAALTCAGSASSGVTAAAGQWLRFAVLATRFADRNRVRASVWPDGNPQPNAWQLDCWDAASESEASGRIGVYSLGSAGNHWDDLLVHLVAPDGAPAGYQPPPVPPPPPPVVSSPPPPPPPPLGYTSESDLAHWWVPGWDLADLGRDFAGGSGAIDAAGDDRGISVKDVSLGGTASAEADFDGRTEALGNVQLRPYGIGNTWSVAAWLQPRWLAGKNRLRYALDLNGAMSKRSSSRISLVLDSAGHFGIVVSDASGAERAIASSTSVDKTRLGSAWYHVVAVKDGTSSLALYVNGARVASTTLGVPQQTDAWRVMRIGVRIKGAKVNLWSGGIGSIGVWHSALSASEVSALYARGNRGVVALR